MTGFGPVALIVNKVVEQVRMDDGMITQGHHAKLLGNFYRFATIASAVMINFCR